MPPFASESAAAAAFKPLSSPSCFNNKGPEPETPFSSLLDDAPEVPAPPSHDRPPPKPQMSEHAAASSPSNTDASVDKAAGGNDRDEKQSKLSQNDGHSAAGTETAADAKSSDSGPADQCKKSDDAKTSGDAKSGDNDKASETCKASDTAAVQTATDSATAVPTPAPVAQPAAPPVAAPIVTTLALQDPPAQATATSEESAKPAGAPDKSRAANAAGTTKLALLKDASAPQDASAQTSGDTVKTTADQTPPSGSQAATGSGKQKPAQSPGTDGVHGAVTTDAAGNADGTGTGNNTNITTTDPNAGDDAKQVGAKNAGARAADNSDNAPHVSAQFDMPAPAGGDISSTTSAGVPQTQQLQATQPATAANSSGPGTPITPTAVPIAGLAVEIAGRALAGKNHFEIRLDPPELGRIDVHLNVDRNGQVTSHLVIDRADTLNLLRQDSTGLERALQDAGLKTADNGLQFSLRDQSMNQNSNTPAAAPAVARIVVPDDAMPTVELPQRIYGRLAGMGGGLDIRV